MKMMGIPYDLKKTNNQHMKKPLFLTMALTLCLGVAKAQQLKAKPVQSLQISTVQPLDPAKRSNLSQLKYANLGQKPSNKVSSSAASFFEDFDGISGATAGGAGTYKFPTNFLLRNVDNRTPDGLVSYVNEAWERREDFANAVSDSAAFSTSFYSPVGAANDFMWTPLVTGITANSVLSWNAVAYDPIYPDGYEVRIMTVAPTGGSGVLGNQLTNSTSILSIAAENSTWTGRTVSLAAYAGQSVFIGFRNNSNDKFLLLIDDIKVEESIAIDAQVIAVDTVSEYTGIPLKQKANLTLGGKIRNNGTSALTNIALKVDVRDSTNAIVATFTSATAASLAPGAINAFAITNVALPNVIGSYTFTFNPVLSAQIDQVPANDALTWGGAFRYTANEYARDNAGVSIGLGIGAGNGGYLGQEFNIISTDVLKSVKATFTRGYTGKKLAAVIYNTLPNGAPNAIVAVTDTLLYLDNAARTYNLPIKGGFAILPIGRYVVAEIEFDSVIQLANPASIFTTKKIWVNWPTIPGGTWTNVETFGASFSKPLMLRPQFGKISGDDVCDAITLNAGSNGPFRHDLSTTQVGEVIPPFAGSGITQGAWLNDGTGITNTMWFKFVATTKKVRILSNWFGSNFDDTQLAVWKANAGACGDLLSASTATLLAANDDSSGIYYGSLITGSTLCLTPGATYYVQVDAYKTSLSSTMGNSLYVILQPIADIIPTITGLNTAYCIGAPAVTLVGSPSGGVFTVNTTASVNYTPTVVGTDSIKYLVNGCFKTTQLITVNALPNVTANASTAAVCLGGTLTLTGGGAATYTWDNSVTNGISFIPPATNNYTVTGTDANNCSSTANVTVTVNALPTITASALSTNICEGNSATVNASGTATSYTWNNGVNSGVAFVPTATNTYTVTGTDANGCSKKDSISVTVNAYPIVNLGGNQSTCSPSLLLDAGNPGSTYAWSTGASTQTINATISGTYNVIVTNTAGCPKSDSALITLNSTLVANLTPNVNSVCEGSPVITLVGTPAGGTFSSNAIGGSFNPTTAGTFTASYIVSNVCGTDTADAMIAVNANPVASLTAPFVSLCAGTPATLTGLPVGGTYSVVSGSPSALVGNVFNASNVGSYSIAYSTTNAAGCTDTAQFNFNVNCVLGLEQNIINNPSFIIMPNPNNGLFTINSNVEVDGTIELINELGQVVYKNRMSGLSKNMNVQNIAAGIYHLRISNGKTSQIKRLSIVK
jgi:hypothetical protein